MAASLTHLNKDEIVIILQHSDPNSIRSMSRVNRRLREIVLQFLTNVISPVPSLNAYRWVMNRVTSDAEVLQFVRHSWNQGYSMKIFSDNDKFIWIKQLNSTKTIEIASSTDILIPTDQPEYASRNIPLLASGSIMEANRVAMRLPLEVDILNICTSRLSDSERIFVTVWGTALGITMVLSVIAVAFNHR